MKKNLSAGSHPIDDVIDRAGSPSGREEVLEVGEGLAEGETSDEHGQEHGEHIARVGSLRR